jgi:hypothetical protein
LSLALHSVTTSRKTVSILTHAICITAYPNNRFTIGHQ